jgi:GT2 family glycosyltransferase
MLLAFKHPPQVIVIDNGSVDSPEGIVAGFPFARYLIEPMAGFYNARNTGAVAARGAYLAFTDSDCRPDRDWLSNAVDYFDSNPDVAAIGGCIELDRSAAPSASELYERIYAFRQERYIGQYGFAATANLIVGRDAFEAVGPFDGTRKSGGDLEWGQRLAVMGRLLRYTGQVLVRHPSRGELGELIRKRQRTAGGRRMAGSATRAVVTNTA